MEKKRSDWTFYLVSFYLESCLFYKLLFSVQNNIINRNIILRLDTFLGENSFSKGVSRGSCYYLLLVFHSKLGSDTIWVVLAKIPLILDKASSQDRPLLLILSSSRGSLPFEKKIQTLDYCVVAQDIHIESIVHYWSSLCRKTLCVYSLWNSRV